MHCEGGSYPQSVHTSFIRTMNLARPQKERRHTESENADRPGTTGRQNGSVGTAAYFEAYLMVHPYGSARLGRTSSPFIAASRAIRT